MDSLVLQGKHGWIPIKDLSDQHIIHELAEFAVTEHNKEANSNLMPQRVIQGESQVVAGTNYRLIKQRMVMRLPRITRQLSGRRMGRVPKI
uniref:Cystatin domain-containing protein n=1 Tax=Nelumbo nucifera TaxID=4432 RepID=A0A822YYS3_NELNU|nr:TPA_asm: hypothetical protein HUJ06_013577 [Nelumbo nucifera]